MDKAKPSPLSPEDHFAQFMFGCHEPDCGGLVAGRAGARNYCKQHLADLLADLERTE